MGNAVTDPSNATSAFTDSLAELAVSWTRCQPGDVRETIESACVGRSIGVEPADGSWSLPERVESTITPAAVRDADTGVTEATIGIADYGTVVIEATPEGTEPVSLFGDKHVAVIREADIVPTMREAIAKLAPTLRDDRKSVILATGPSATADMGSLVQGAHGPKTVHVVIVESESNGGMDDA
ncbi:MAG: LutC/YkgG family protein [Halobacteriota archaeon]